MQILNCKKYFKMNNQIYIIHLNTFLKLEMKWTIITV